MIANETTRHKSPNDTEISNYKSHYSLTNESYRIVSYKRPEITKWEIVPSEKQMA